MDDIKRPGTFWLSMKFALVFWSKNMCKREKFSKVGFFGNKSLGRFASDSYILAIKSQKSANTWALTIALAD